MLPIAIVGAVLAGRAFALAVTPIGSGDYGQWLMVSRRFLGESVPAYRSLSEVPPLVPMLLAGIRAVVHDPFVSLHVVATVLLVALGASLATLGTWAIHSRWAGAWPSRSAFS